MKFKNEYSCCNHGYWVLLFIVIQNFAFRQHSLVAEPAKDEIGRVLGKLSWCSVPWESTVLIQCCSYAFHLVIHSVLSKPRTRDQAPGFPFSFAVMSMCCCTFLNWGQASVEWSPLACCLGVHLKFQTCWVWETFKCPGAFCCCQNLCKGISW